MHCRCSESPATLTAPTFRERKQKVLTMSVLVLGASGYIGSNVVLHLAAARYVVHALYARFGFPLVEPLAHSPSVAAPRPRSASIFHPTCEPLSATHATRGCCGHVARAGA